MNDLISVIIPAYNLESKIEKCLTSIINQTYKNLEIIVVDDGSTDDTANVVKSFSDPRIHLIQRDNHGVSSARNAGLDATSADSKFISFIDGDDVVLISYYEEMMRVVEEHGADIVQCRIKPYSDNEVFLIDISNTEGMVRIYDTLDSRIELFMENDFETSFQCNKLFRKNIFKKIRFRDGYIHEGEDLILKELQNCHRLVTLDRNLYGYLENDMTNISETEIIRFLTNGLDARESQCRELHSMGMDEEIPEIRKRALDEYIYRYVNYVEPHHWEYRKEVLRRLFVDAYRASNVRFGIGDHIKYILFSISPIFAQGYKKC